MTSGIDSISDILEMSVTMDEEVIHAPLTEKEEERVRREADYENFQKQTGTDAQLLFADKTISIHKKYFLNARPHFTNALGGDWAQPDILDMSDESPDNIDMIYEVIIFLYIGQIGLRVQLIEPLIHFVSKYFVDKLKNVCFQFLTDNIYASPPGTCLPITWLHAARLHN